MGQPGQTIGTTRVRLSGHEIDLTRDELLTLRGEPVILRPRSFAVLRRLAESLGQLVTKDELLAAVWSDVAVTEDSLVQCVADIRRAIGDGARVVVRTVPRRGYRLVGDPIPPPHTAPHESMAADRGLAMSRTLLPLTRYARSGDLHIAYQVTGDGPVDLVLAQGFVTHLDIEWEHPVPAQFFSRLWSHGRLIRFDRRGLGLSDRIPALPSLEERMDDIRAVMDAAGSERAVLMGMSEGGPLGILFAATYPERVSALILYGSFARAAWAADNPWGMPEARVKEVIQLIEERWGQGNSVDVFAPSMATDSTYRAWRGRMDRAGASPSAAQQLMLINNAIDVRHVLPSIRVPTLILHRTGDRAVMIDHGRALARGIPGAKLVEMPGDNHAPGVGDLERLCTEVRSFVETMSEAPEPDRVLSTILCVAFGPPDNRTIAKPRGMSMGIVRQETAHFRGREIAMEPDRYLNAFDGPARAVRCGRAIVDACGRYGFAVRAGIHTGECDVRGATLGGATPRIAARIAELARTGEVLVSRTVRDLIAGAAISFESRGEPALLDRRDALPLYLAR